MSTPASVTGLSRSEELLRLVHAWMAQRGGNGPGAVTKAATVTGEGSARPRLVDGSDVGVRETGEEVRLQEVEVLRAGRPGLVDVVTQVGDRLLHLVLGVRRPGEEAHLLRAGDDPILGLLDDSAGLGVVVDALRDTELARLVLESVHGGGGAVDPGPPAPVSDSDEGAVLAFGEDCTLTVFSWLFHGPHPGVELLVALDEAGFNHLAAPLALWRRGGRDLGLVQEGLAGCAGGWALALTSLRDLYAAGGSPEAAGGDFAPEARALGTMTARMHLAMDRAFGRRSGEIGHWAEAVERVLRTSEPSLLDREGILEALEMLKSSGLKASTLRTHGDFHLGRTARTDQGWVVADFMPGGIPPGADAPVFRSPLADVADMLWSLHHVASVAALERDPTGRAGLAGMAQAWEARNRRAFLAGYLATPGIGGLVPSDRRIVRGLVAVFEAEHAALRSGGSQTAP